MGAHQHDRPAGVGDRREFLQQLAVLGVGTWAGARGIALPAVRPTIDRLGVGLFTVFGEMRQDFDGTLAAIRRIGYHEVEFAGYYGRTPEQVRQVLDRVGLTAPSTHIGLDLLRTAVDAQVHAAQVIGHQYITVPSLPRSVGPLRTVDAWQRVAEEFNGLGRTLRAGGVRLAFHSHRDEYVDLGGGRKGMDVFITETDPALVAFEMDLGWARVAGEDPVQWFARYPGRFPMWHVKDIKGLAEAQARQAEAFRNPPPPPQGPPAMPPTGGPPPGGPPPGGTQAAAPLTGPAPMGEGEIDYRPIFAAWQRSGLEHFFVEQDLAMRWPGGALTSLQTSYDYMRRLLA
ncbi:MAG TPA: sugar phosphate isomerase/epimerase [Gemmatirosa sp.]